MLYAVKANPSPWVIRELVGKRRRRLRRRLDPRDRAGARARAGRAAGVHASGEEPRGRSPRPISITACGPSPSTAHEELAKILDATGGAQDLNLIVRLAVEAPGAAYSLAGKFGVDAARAPRTCCWPRAARPHELMGVSFHVGSQCMRPSAFQAAMAQASRALVRAGVFADVVDVGGGFPSVYPGMIPPDLAEYVAAIDRGFAEMMVHETTELWCEPGRALVAEGSSLLTRVELRKGDALYLNDGAYGSLFDAAHAKWPFPVKLVRADGEERRAAASPFRFFGPTCDSARPHAGPVLAAGGRGRGRLHRDRHAGRLWRRHGDPLQRLRRRRDRRGRGSRRWPRCSASRRARSRSPRTTRGRVKLSRARGKKRRRR